MIIVPARVLHRPLTPDHYCPYQLHGCPRYVNFDRRRGETDRVMCRPLGGTLCISLVYLTLVLKQAAPLTPLCQECAVPISPL